MSENPATTRSFGIAEIAGTALIVPAVLVLLALVSYQDASATGQAASNLIGAGGHVTAELLFYLFGFAAFVIPPYVLAVGAYCLLYSRVPDLLLRAIALFILVIAGAVLIYLVNGVDESMFWSGGGVMGRRLGDALETIVGRYGAYILALGALLPGLMLGSPYSLPQLVRGFFIPLFTGAERSIHFSFGALSKLRLPARAPKERPAAESSAKAEHPDAATTREPTSPDGEPEATRPTASAPEPAAARRPERNHSQHMQRKPEERKAMKATRGQPESNETGSAVPEGLPFFGRVHASHKPWFERADEPAALPGRKRGELERISPTYGRAVALDNAFLLSTRARHVRSLLEGLAATESDAIDDKGEVDPSGPVPTGRRGRDLRPPVPPRPLRPDRPAGKAGTGRAARGGTGDDFAGFFTEDDSRFHFRSLNLDGEGRRARASVAVDESPPERFERPVARARRMPGEAEPLLRPINLRILEREQERQRSGAADYEPGAGPGHETLYPGRDELRAQARGIGQAGPGALSNEVRDATGEEQTEGALALARDESRPYSTRPVENFQSEVPAPTPEALRKDASAPSAAPDAATVTDDPAELDPEFLEVENAVEAALAETDFSNTEEDTDAEQLEAAEMEAAEMEAAEMEAASDAHTAGEPMRYQRPAKKEAPPFPDLPPVEVLRPDYYIPRDILRMPNRLPPEDVKGEIEVTCKRLEKTLSDFGIKAEIVRTQRGPIITLYEIRPEAGIKVSRIMGIVDEIKMNLEARSVRIIAPIPGKNTVGIEIPNRRREEVTLGELVRHDPQFFAKSRELSLAMGKNISGENGYVDLTRLPHLLIAGATGAGKSVYMNTVIASLLYTRSPQELRFIMIDPKMVELTLFEGIPHLLMPVITDVKQASRALNWAVAEMERRYAYLSYMKCRDIRSYNSKFARGNARGSVSAPEAHMPYLVIFIDELSDLMIMAPKDVEDSIIRLTQKARAVGIHIVMATQRPSVDVITALIKANCPARIAFQVAQKTDSRVILDANGAETLLGRGDMLYKTPAATGLGRIQTPLIEETEIERIVEETRRFGRPSYIEMPGAGEADDEFSSGDDDVDRGLFEEAWKIVQETGKTSTSYIQRRLRIGYNRAARIIEMMEEKGYLGPQIGNRPREILKKD